MDLRSAPTCLSRAVGRVTCGPHRTAGARGPCGGRGVATPYGLKRSQATATVRCDRTFRSQWRFRWSATKTVPRGPGVRSAGALGWRRRDLNPQPRLAKAVLCQLSYVPGLLAGVLALSATSWPCRQRRQRPCPPSARRCRRPYRPCRRPCRPVCDTLSAALSALSLTVSAAFAVVSATLSATFGLGAEESNTGW